MRSVAVVSWLILATFVPGANAWWWLWNNCLQPKGGSEVCNGCCTNVAVEFPWTYDFKPWFTFTQSTQYEISLSACPETALISATLPNGHVTTVTSTLSMDCCAATRPATAQMSTQPMTNPITPGATSPCSGVTVTVTREPATVTVTETGAGCSPIASVGTQTGGLSSLPVQSEHTSTVGKPQTNPQTISSSVEVPTLTTTIVTSGPVESCSTMPGCYTTSRGSQLVTGTAVTVICTTTSNTPGVTSPPGPAMTLPPLVTTLTTVGTTETCSTSIGSYTSQRGTLQLTGPATTVLCTTTLKSSEPSSTPPSSSIGLPPLVTTITTKGPTETCSTVIGSYTSMSNGQPLTGPATTVLCTTTPGHGNSGPSQTPSVGLPPLVTTVTTEGPTETCSTSVGSYTSMSDGQQLTGPATTVSCTTKPRSPATSGSVSTPSALLPPLVTTITTEGPTETCSTSMGSYTSMSGGQQLTGPATTVLCTTTPASPANSGPAPTSGASLPPLVTTITTEGPTETCSTSMGSYTSMSGGQQLTGPATTVRCTTTPASPANSSPAPTSGASLPPLVTTITTEGPTETCSTSMGSYTSMSGGKQLTGPATTVLCTTTPKSPANSGSAPTSGASLPPLVTTITTEGPTETCSTSMGSYTSMSGGKQLTGPATTVLCTTTPKSPTNSGSYPTSGAALPPLVTTITTEGPTETCSTTMGSYTSIHDGQQLTGPATTVLCTTTPRSPANSGSAPTSGIGLPPLVTTITTEGPTETCSTSMGSYTSSIGGKQLTGPATTVLCTTKPRTPANTGSAPTSKVALPPLVTTITTEGPTETCSTSMGSYTSMSGGQQLTGPATTVLCTTTPVSPANSGPAPTSGASLPPLVTTITTEGPTETCSTSMGSYTSVKGDQQLTGPATTVLCTTTPGAPASSAPSPTSGASLPPLITTITTEGPTETCFTSMGSYTSISGGKQLTGPATTVLCTTTPKSPANSGPAPTSGASLPPLVTTITTEGPTETCSTSMGSYTSMSGGKQLTGPATTVLCTTTPKSPTNSGSYPTSEAALPPLVTTITTEGPTETCSTSMGSYTSVSSGRQLTGPATTVLCTTTPRNSASTAPAPTSEASLPPLVTTITTEGPTETCSTSMGSYTSVKGGQQLTGPATTVLCTTRPGAPSSSVPSPTSGAALPPIVTTITREGSTETCSTSMGSYTSMSGGKQLTGPATTVLCTTTPGSPGNPVSTPTSGATLPPLVTTITTEGPTETCSTSIGSYTSVKDGSQLTGPATTVLCTTNPSTPSPTLQTSRRLPPLVTTLTTVGPTETCSTTIGSYTSFEGAQQLTGPATTALCTTTPILTNPNPTETPGVSVTSPTSVSGPPIATTIYTSGSAAVCVTSMGVYTTSSGTTVLTGPITSVVCSTTNLPSAVTVPGVATTITTIGSTPTTITNLGVYTTVVGTRTLTGPQTSVVIYTTPSAPVSLPGQVITTTVPGPSATTLTLPGVYTTVIGTSTLTGVITSIVVETPTSPVSPVSTPSAPGVASTMATTITMAGPSPTTVTVTDVYTTTVGTSVLTGPVVTVIVETTIAQSTSRPPSTIPGPSQCVNSPGMASSIIGNLEYCNYACTQLVNSYRASSDCSILSQSFVGICNLCASYYGNAEVESSVQTSSNHFAEVESIFVELGSKCSLVTASVPVCFTSTSSVETSTSAVVPSYSSAASTSPTATPGSSPVTSVASQVTTTSPDIIVVTGAVTYSRTPAAPSPITLTYVSQTTLTYLNEPSIESILTQPPETYAVTLNGKVTVTGVITGAYGQSVSVKTATITQGANSGGTYGGVVQCLDEFNQCVAQNGPLGLLLCKKELLLCKCRCGVSLCCLLKAKLLL